MTQIRSLFFLAFIVVATACSNNSDNATMSQPSHPIAIALHGGAGNIEKMNLSEEDKARYLFVMDSALQIGYSVLQNGGTSTDAVEKVICALEDCPLFNAGKGAVFSHEGRNEMDAAIMNGADLECGAIAGVRHVKNPIQGARTVMEQSKHILLYGAGAEEFLKKKDVEMVDTSYFYTTKRWEQLQKALEKNTNGLDHDENSGDNKYGTVGCVALDINGNLCAGTSTGGTVNKRYNRIGDSPLIGAGTYADNNTCAISCTGKGEDFMRLVAAHDISSQMKYKSLSLYDAINNTIQVSLKSIEGRGGCIGLDNVGNIVFSFTTSGMFRAGIDGKGSKTLSIY